MKKILALILALMMALSCTGVLAEAAPVEVTEPEPEALSIQADLGEGVTTVTGSLSVDTDTLLMILNMMGVVDEDMLPTITTILNVVNNASGKVGLFENGAQVDIQLQDTPIVSIAGAAADENLVIGSDLIPNYLIVISQEFIMQMVEPYIAQFQDLIAQGQSAAEGIDPEALMNAVMPHVMTFVSALQEKVGEPEVGEYEFEGAAFQAKVPINLTVKEAFSLASDLIHGILGEEAVAGLVDTLVSASGAPIDLNSILERLDELVADVQETPDEDQPAMEIALYSGADEEGNSTNIYFTASLIKDDQTMSICGGKVNGAVYGHINVFDELTVDASAGMGETGLSASLKISFQGLFIGIEAQMAGLSDISVALYFMNPMAPVATVKVAVTPGAENTLALDSEGKTVVTLEQLMNDETGEVSGGLMMDVMYYGLSGVMGKAMQILPEDVSALMDLLSGSGSEAEVIEE